MITFERAREAVHEDWPDYDLSPAGFEGDADWFVLLSPLTIGGRIAAVSKASGDIRWINENADEYNEQRPVSVAATRSLLDDDELRLRGI